MGNQLVGIAPSQVYPVEHYFVGVFNNEITYDLNMGSTRFFKVARAKTEEGIVVVKVFVKHDPTLPLEHHKDRLEYIKKTLANAVNCLPFQRIELTDKAAYLMREYVKHSLYDRVSTRPFLTILEKKWITFQILYALNQCHKQKICHGDVKLENILITSWNWVLLSDFASFKPTYLPEDNPADYTYYFDTSRRRTCYIAPERFVTTLSLEDSDGNESMFPTDSLIRMGPAYLTIGNTLCPSMDIFSTGCALLELWTEGTAPFELSQLLAYRKGDRELVEKHLKSIENVRLRNLLASMIDINPINRKSAEVYLDQERGELFPEYFYSFLQPYLQMFSSPPVISPDDKILRLHSDIGHCIKVLTNRNNEVTPENEISEDIFEEDIEKNEPQHCERLLQEQDGLILIISVVTSCIRGLRQSNTKICALEILKKLSRYTTSETVLDRILPYILHLAQYSSANVQVQAIEILTACLSMVKDIPQSDANVFPEYILPLISPLSTEQSAVIVRVAFARHIAKLSKIAIYFLEETQRNAPNDMPPRRYEAELSALHDIVQQNVLSLLTDSNAVVKRSLIESGICDLCAFFGKDKANDVILSHIMTFLNDEDKDLRGSFYENIAGVAGYVGWQASDILVPLLQQGFTDREEFVIAKAIQAITTLIELGHIRKPILTEIIEESACYLCHPNLWIRHEIAGMISTTARILSSIDVQCKIIPAIEKFLKNSLIQVEKVEFLLDSLQPPIPRQVYKSVLRFPDIEKLFSTLEERERTRKETCPGSLSVYEDMGNNMRNLFRRLTIEGLNDLVETQLLLMKPFLLKMNHKSQQNQVTTGEGSSSSESSPIASNGRIVIDPRIVPIHEFPLEDKTMKLRLDSGGSGGGGGGVTVVSEGVTPTIASPGSDANISPTAAAREQTATASAATSLGEYTMPERNYWQEHSSQCLKDLEDLHTKYKSQYSVLALSLRHSTANGHHSTPYPSGWRMAGSMVAHLHEHADAVIRLAPLKPNGAIFASGSIDGTVRLWDCNKLNGNQGINKSRQIYSANTSIHAIAACDGGQSLAVGGKDGSLLIMRIDRNSSKMTLQQALHLNQGNKFDDAVVDMHSNEASPHVFLYATLYGGINAWDTRMQQCAYRLNSDLRHGVLTTICADPTGSWLATGTSSGKHLCWDLRFQLQIAEIKHPADSWVRKVICHPTEPSCLISSTQSNNEVSIWNVETGHRQTVLWASAAPVFAYESGKPKNAQSDPSATCGLLSGVTPDSGPFILTGSSDQRIRYWDINDSKNSALIVPSSLDHLLDLNFNYSSRHVEGTQVIEETIIDLGNAIDPNAASEENPRSGPDMPTESHHDAITDLLMCKTDKGQIYIASASRDGVIKLWK